MGLLKKSNLKIETFLHMANATWHGKIFKADYILAINSDIMQENGTLRNHVHN